MADWHLSIVILLAYVWLVFAWPKPPNVIWPGLAWFSHKLFRISELIVATISASVLGILLYVMLHSMREPTIEIALFDVPKDLSNRGFTATVAARRLRDSIEHIVSIAGPSMERPRFLPAGPDVVIHEVWLQPEAIAAWLGKLLNLRPPKEISDEVTISRDAQESQRLCLDVRLNGLPFPGSVSCIRFEPKASALTVNPIIHQKEDWCAILEPKYEASEDRDIYELFEGVAWRILEITDPLFPASECSAAHRAVASRIAHRLL